MMGNEFDYIAFGREHIELNDYLSLDDKNIIIDLAEKGRNHLIILKKIYDSINSLGGVPANQIEAAENEMIGKCLALIEEHLS